MTEGKAQPPLLDPKRARVPGLKNNPLFHEFGRQKVPLFLINREFLCVKYTPYFRVFMGDGLLAGANARRCQTMPWHRWAEIWHRSAEEEFSGWLCKNRETSRWSNRLQPVSLWLTTILHRYKLGLHPPLISGESTCQRKSISVEIANFCREKVPFFTKTRIALLPQKLPLFSWKVEHEYVPFLGPRGGGWEAKPSRVSERNAASQPARELKQSLICFNPCWN